MMPEERRRDLGILAGIVLLLFSLAASPVFGQDFRLRASDKQEDEGKPGDLRAEVLFGKEVAARILGAYGLLEDPGLSRYVGRVGKAVSLHAGRPELEFRFAVLDAEEVNAFAAPGGYVFVTRGALRRMRSEAELAAVLAHEIAHVTEKHIVRELKIRGSGGSGAILASLVGGATDPMRTAFRQMVDEAVRILFERGYAEADELEADRVGTTLAFLTGYNPTALQSFLGRLSDMGSGAMKRFVRTHPQRERRLADLEEFLTANSLSNDNAIIQKGRFKAHVSFRSQ